MRNLLLKQPLIAQTAEVLFTGLDKVGIYHLQTLKSKKNLDYIKTLPCVICGRTPTDPDHVKTRGAGGGDQLSNINPLCRACHITRHTIGIKTFLNKYYTVILENRKKLNLPKLKHEVFD